MANKNMKCVWNMGGPCSDDVKEVVFFNDSIRVPVCSDHIEQHKFVMILHKNGYDVEEVLRESPEYRKGEVLVLKLSGLDDDNVKL